MELTAKDIVGFWKGRYADVRNRFVSANRRNYMRELAEELFENGICLQEAKSLWPIVQAFFITEKGKNNSSWKNTVRDDYENIVYSTYETRTDFIEKKNGNIGENIVPHYLLNRSEIIVAWSKFRFGLAWNESYCHLCHLVGHRFNLEFIQDVLDKDWVTSGIDVPEWFSKEFLKK